MADEQVIHGAAISIDANDPEATAISVWEALGPVVFAAQSAFTSKAQRAQFLATFACSFSGAFAAEFGFSDAADLFEMVAKITRNSEAKGAGRPH